MEVHDHLLDMLELVTSTLKLRHLYDEGSDEEIEGVIQEAEELIRQHKA